MNKRWLKKGNHIHFVGIKGVAMTALAVLAKEVGCVVTGSDVADTFPTDEVLQAAGIVPLIGFSSDHVRGDIIVYTGAHGGRENIEVVEAMKRGIPVYAHGKALGIAMAQSRQISVAGCHGKTTTTAMIASMMKKQDPSYAIGSGMIRGLGLPGHFGTGPWFIAEADEYVTEPKFDMTPRFLWQHPDILVITTIDFDHPDVYASMDDVRHAYGMLIAQQTGRQTCISAYEDVQSAMLRNEAPGHHITCGFDKQADVVITRTSFSEDMQDFTLKVRTRLISQPAKDLVYTLAVPGAHNALNATMAIIACVLAGTSWEDCREALRLFGGAARRFEYIGTYRTFSVIDDYAHHPKEIRATLAAARERYRTGRIVVIFQPHTYSRTRALLADFSEAFSDADAVCITDIYASAREKIGGVTGEDLVCALEKNGKNVYSTRTKEDVRLFLNNLKGENGVILCMGAGDIGSWMREIIAE